MNTLRCGLVLALLALAGQPIAAQQSSPQTGSVPASCHMTPRPEKEFIPPADYHLEKLPDNSFLIGTEKLWTEISEPMVWPWRPRGPGHEHDLTAKTFWLRVGYSWRSEPHPKLKVSGRRLDGDAPPLVVLGPMTHAILDSQGRGAMLAGVYVPTPGCWEITGDYEGDKLSFVVWVEPLKASQ